MPGSDSFANLMKRLQSGEDAAAREVFLRFARRLIGLARGRLTTRLAAKVDPEDIVQSAYKSFFLRHERGDLEVDNWDGLWGLLTLITLRKCADRAAYFQRDKRDIGREWVAAAPAATPTPLETIALDREPSPEEAAMLAETVQSLFEAVNDPDERDILELSLQGYTTAEISEKLGRAERSVRRLRERWRQRLEKSRED